MAEERCLLCNASLTTARSKHCKCGTRVCSACWAKSNEKDPQKCPGCRFKFQAHAGPPSASATQQPTAAQKAANTKAAPQPGAKKSFLPATASWASKVSGRPDPAPVVKEPIATPPPAAAPEPEVVPEPKVVAPVKKASPPKVAKPAPSEPARKKTFAEIASAGLGGSGGVDVAARRRVQADAEAKAKDAKRALQEEEQREQEQRALQAEVQESLVQTPPQETAARDTLVKERTAAFREILRQWIQLMTQEREREQEREEDGVEEVAERREPVRRAQPPVGAPVAASEAQECGRQSSGSRLAMWRSPAVETPKPRIAEEVKKSGLNPHAKGWVGAPAAPAAAPAPTQGVLQGFGWGQMPALNTPADQKVGGNPVPAPQFAADAASVGCIVSPFQGTMHQTGRVQAADRSADGQMPMSRQPGALPVHT